MIGLGALLAMAMPLPSWWWLGWVGVAPVVALIAASADRREALWRAWLGGVGFLLALHYWLIPHMGVFTVPAAAFAGLFWLPLGLAIWTQLGPKVRGGARAYWALLLIPSVWVAVEGLRSWQYLGGTWGLWGLSQWQVGPILQTAAIGGVWLLSLLLVATNTALVVVALPGVDRAARLAAAGLALTVPGAMLLYGLTRPPAPVTGEVRVAGMQPGVFDSAWDRLEAHADLTLAVTDRDPDFVVWGQSSVAFDPEQEPEVDRLIREVSQQVGADILVNIDAQQEGDRILKVFVQYTPEGPGARYAKQRLVPFGEYIPLRPLFGWVARFTEAANQDRARGGEVDTMTVAGIEVGPLVSYESTFPGMRRELARLGADVTVVQGSTWTFQGTWAQPQQASYEAVAAVATGRPALLVAVSGTSSAFDARGRLLAWRPADWVGAFLVEIPLSREEPAYVRYGDWALWMAWVVTGAAAAGGATAWWKRRGTS